MSSRKPILVTGSHRSGTGWVGQMIAATPAPRVAYVWEPFSLHVRPGICDAHWRYWFPYVCSDNEAAYVGPVGDTVRFRYKPVAELLAVRSPRDAGRMARDWAATARFRARHARPLLKDPIAVFSSEWLCDTFDMDCIVLVRHPAAFVDSIIWRELRHPFEHFLAQSLLMRDLLGDHEDEIRRYAEREQSLLDQGILLWILIHDAILRFRKRRPQWQFLRLEDIAREPQANFREMYDRLGLVFDDGVARTIEEHSSAGNPEKATSMAAVKRDSQASIVAWKRHLTQAQIDEIRGRVAPISDAFYGDEDW